MQGGAQRVAGITGRRLDVNVLEGSLGEKAGVHHRVQGDPSCQRQIGLSGELVQRAGHVQGRLFGDCLDAEGDVLVVIGDLRFGHARRAEPLLKPP